MESGEDRDSETGVDEEAMSENYEINGSVIDDDDLNVDSNWTGSPLILSPPSNSDSSKDECKIMSLKVSHQTNNVLKIVSNS